MKPIFEVRETQLCAELGVSLRVLRERRAYFLAQGTHWDYVKKRVLLSAAGAAILRGTREAILPCPGQKSAPSADYARNQAIRGLLLEKNPPPIAFSGELVVWATSARNPRLVTAYIPGTDPTDPLNLVAVRVRDNVNFLRGMKLPGPQRGLERTDEQTFNLVGACPRWRGKW